MLWICRQAKKQNRLSSQVYNLLYWPSIIQLLEWGDWEVHRGSGFFSLNFDHELRNRLKEFGVGRKGCRSEKMMVFTYLHCFTPFFFFLKQTPKLIKRSTPGVSICLPKGFPKEFLQIARAPQSLHYCESLSGKDTVNSGLGTTRS